MKRNKWYPIIIVGTTVLFVLSVGFAVLVYISKTPTNFGYSPNVWDFIYDFLDKWASAGAPAMTLLAVAAALGIGLAGILQTRNIQKNEFKLKLLAEIVKWAESILNDGAVENMMQLAEAIQEAKTTASINIDEWKRVSQERAGTIQYITEIASCFDKPLKDAVERLVTDLETYVRTLKNEQGLPATAVTIYTAKQKLQLYISANKVIIEVAKIHATLLKA